MSIDENPKKILIIIISLLFIFGLFFLFIVSKKTELEITSSVPGSDYVINNNIKGKTPATVKLRPGNYEIVLSREGKETINKSFNVPAWGDKKIKLNYSFVPRPGYVSPGAGSINQDKSKKQSEEFQKKFPYWKSLPFEGGTFYIDTPFSDGTINIYLKRESQDQGKKDAYNWFLQKGFSDPSSLKIKWIVKD